ncbi:hypothetical protein DH2020_019974 [Rehmannia glutinosa]|uniref:Adenylate kinase n=1 Tax=Rehmannia glutinosa TaxID=99300 RepID=A0ABR0WG25_REHGL
MGAPGAGKSRLAIDLAIHFDGQIINSDKIQVYKGLDIITNKVTNEERRGSWDSAAIGVPELDEFFKHERIVDGETRAKLLKEAIDEIKENTCMLCCRQFKKILKMAEQLQWRIHRLDATEAFMKCGTGDAAEAWKRSVVGPSTRIVSNFLGRVVSSNSSNSISVGTSTRPWAKKTSSVALLWSDSIWENPQIEYTAFLS